MNRAILLLAALFAACSDGGSTQPVASQSELPPISADGAHVKDALGREVLLRGFNHIGLRSDRNHPGVRDDHGDLTPDAQLFELEDLQDADFDFIASTGVNTLRLVVTWEFAQPDPPPAPYNERYFALIDDFIAKARRRGLYVVFDFGQFGWGRSTGGNAGAPDWTVSDTCKQLPNGPPNAPPQASGPVGCAYYNFWTNAQIAGVSLQDAYLDLWRFVATRYRGDRAVAIFDLYNEPFPGPIPPIVFEQQYLYPFYQRLAQAIREIDPDRTIGFQPELYHSLGVPTPFGSPLGIDNAVYLPHEYTLAYFQQRVDPSYTPAQDTETRAYLALNAVEASMFGTPWLLGETGWTRTTSADGVGGPISAEDAQAPRDFARDFTGAADEQKLGWLWFAYSSIDAAYGVIYGDAPDVELITNLARPYPRAIAGAVGSFSFDPASGEYLQSTSALTDAPSEIALPIAWQYADGACIEGDGVMLGAVTAGGHASGAGVAFDSKRQTLTMTRLPAQLRISRGPC